MPGINNYFAIGEPTNSQKNALRVLEDFFTSSNQCLLLKGSAGTGKTSLLKSCIDYLQSVDIPCTLMAPTGRAAKIMSDKTGKHASTIHKIIYSFNDLQFDEKEEEGYFEFYYRLHESKDNANTVYIVDESSMVPDVDLQDSFLRFGSGRLLNDIFSYVNLSTYPRRKIIFVGDEIQLPPIMADTSPALNVNYLKETHSVDAHECKLVEVVRQSKGSGILVNAEILREAIVRSNFRNMSLKTKYSNIYVIQRDHLLQQYLRVCDNKLDEKTIIIAYSNYAVQRYNRLVRGYFFPQNSDITTGDKVIVINNNYAYEIELLNGDFGVVLDVSASIERREVFLKQRARIDERVVLLFRDVVIQFVDVKGKNRDIRCKILENCLASNKGAISSSERKALLVDFKIRNKHLKKDKKKFLDEISKDPYFNCLQVKYGYAITCHKAQGGEWDNVFVDFKRPAKCNDISYYRWAYTALTRARNNLFYIRNTYSGGNASNRTHIA